MATRAAELDDPLKAGLELLGLRDIRNFVVALEAARLDEPLRQHREIPHMNCLPVILLLPLVALLEVLGGMRRKREIGAGALAAVTDRAAKTVDRVRSVRVEIQTGVNHITPGIFRLGALCEMRVQPEYRRHVLAVSSLIVSGPFNSLVTGRATVVARHFLEIVVDRQVREADLLNLGWRHQVDAGKASEKCQ